MQCDLRPVHSGQNLCNLYITLSRSIDNHHSVNTNMEDSCDGGSQWRDCEILDLIGIEGDTSVQAKFEGLYMKTIHETINADFSGLRVTSLLLLLATFF